MVLLGTKNLLQYHQTKTKCASVFLLHSTHVDSTSVEYCKIY